jgi:XTP/dITP diphosphohydrolase
VVRGELRGVVTTAPRGAGGFGYDPVLELPDGRTAAELTAEEKNAISHRGQAFRALAPLLVAALGA